MSDERLDYGVVQKAAEKRFTLGVLYKATNDPSDPDLDAHREFVLADDLQHAQWEYVKTGDRRIWLQHKDYGAVPIGEWVDIAAWPFPVNAQLKLPDDTVRKATIPSGSIWMGCLWNERGWALVKKGQIRGLSMGGFAKRVEVVLKGRDAMAQPNEQLLNEEIDMSNDNVDTPEFIEFRDKLQAALDSCPTEDDKARFIQIVTALANRIDSTQSITKAARRSVLEQVLGALDRLAKREERGVWKGIALAKALRKAELTDEDKPLGNDPEIEALRTVVKQAAARVTSANIEQRGVRRFDDRLKRLDDDLAEFAEEEEARATWLRKSDPPAGTVRDIVKHLEEFQAWMIEQAPNAKEKADTKRHTQILIDAYKAWLAREQ
jgi:hypothetical protein